MPSIKTGNAYADSIIMAIVGISALLIALKFITKGLMVINKNRMAKMTEKGRARNKRLWSITADQMKKFKISKSVIDTVRTEFDFESRVKELKRLKKHKLENLIARTTGLDDQALQDQTEATYSFLRWYKPQRLAELTLRDRIVNSWYGDVVSGFLFVIFISQSSSVMNAITIAGVSSGTMSEHKAATYGTGGEIGTTFTAHLAAFGMALAKLPFKYLAFLIPVGFVTSWTMTLVKKIRVKWAAGDVPPPRRPKSQNKFVLYFERFKDPKHIKALGKAIGGLGLIFLALEIIGNAFKTPEARSLLGNVFSGFDNVWLLMIVSVIATGIVSSSSLISAVTVSLLLPLQDGTTIITVQQGIAILCGANIGTCFTTNIAAFGQSKAARRAAMMTLHLNLIPALVFTTIMTFKPGQELIVNGLGLLSANPARQAAWFHTFFNVSALLLFPFLGWMLALQRKMNPDDGQGFFEKIRDGIKVKFAKHRAAPNDPMPGVELRLATMDELEPIKNGYINLVKYLRRHDIRIWYAGYPMNMLSDAIKRDELYVLARGKTLVGAVALSRKFLHDKYFTWQAPEDALYLIHFGIFPEFLKKKLSYKFLELIEQHAMGKSYKSLRLMIDHTHATALKMFTNFGFKHTGGDYIPEDYPERIKYGFEKEIKEGTEVANED